MKRWNLWLILILVLLSVYFDVPKLPVDFKFSTPAVGLPFNQKISPITVDSKNLFDKFPIKLGLDLQGGTELILQTDMSKIPEESKDDALESAKQVIEKRVNLFGVSEAVVQTSKQGDNRRIIVELPGVKDASQAASLVGKTAQLDFREIVPTDGPESSQSAILDLYNAKPTGLTGADLKKAQVSFGGGQSTQAGPAVTIIFTSEGAKKFADITKRNIGKQVPIFLDNQPVSAPVVQQAILDGNAVISGDFTTEEAKNLAIQLNAGALPVPITPVDQHTIGATLGQESINKSIVAGVIGIIIVMVYMALYYGWLGLVADLALIIYALFVLAIFKTGLFILPPVTLTLAGIAGFILSIGMAVDANILIFERMKEEKRWGKSSAQALDLGFKRAWSSIRDSNISSLITAAILYFLGTGPVKGFAITLAIGVLVSMFTAVFVTKQILKLLIRK